MQPARGNNIKATVEPYVGKLELFELFSTAQAYYIVASDKYGTSYRVLKFDRTLIEYDDLRGDKNYANDPPSRSTTPSQETSHDEIPFLKTSASDTSQNNTDDQHSRKSSLRPLSDFCTEDPIIYTADEINEMLNMINDGNQGPSRHGKKPNDQSKDNSTTKRGGGNGSRGLQPLVKAHGIVGFTRFLDCYYVTLITKTSEVGSIGGNCGIYTIKDTETFPLKPAERSVGSSNSNGLGGGLLDGGMMSYSGGTSSISGSGGGSDPQSVLLNMWNRGKRSLNFGLTNRELAELRYIGLYQVVDLTKDFFFSYTYDITKSLQENMLFMTSQTFPPPPFKDMYSWNYFLTRELEDITSKSLSSYYWVMPIVHGAFIQRKLSDYGRSLNLTLLARRSRHFAGTRYLKRGVSDRGKVANDVEHEQILHDETSSPATFGTFSSFLQVRGSIPTYWTQESSATMPKPPIVLNRVDPTYQATKVHFEDLIKRYGSPIIVADLVKQSEKREREVIVGNEFRHAIDYLNCHIEKKHKIRYCAFDYSHMSKHQTLNVSPALQDLATWAVNQTGFFCSVPRWKIVKDRVEPYDDNNSCGAAFLTHNFGVPAFPMEQKGVLRTNCIVSFAHRYIFLFLVFNM